jgi:hypothetical protein
MILWVYSKTSFFAAKKISLEADNNIDQIQGDSPNINVIDRLQK